MLTESNKQYSIRRYCITYWIQEFQRECTCSKNDIQFILRVYCQDTSRKNLSSAEILFGLHFTSNKPILYRRGWQETCLNQNNDDRLFFVKTEKQCAIQKL